MNILYDSRRVFWPANAPAKAIPIDIDSDTEISSMKNVQDAIQMIVDDISCTVGKLPDKIENREDKTLNKVITTLNSVIDALQKLKTDGK